MTAHQWQVSESALPEDFGDEIICMAVDSGVFYSMRGSAAALWRAVAAGAQQEAITEAIAATSDAETLAALLDDLTRDGILRLVDTEAHSPPAPDLGGAGPGQYARNDQFNDLVLLDPIHDVTERGWPFR
jgi:hypothetical protein